jgi:hypothetical protein
MNAVALNRSFVILDRRSGIQDQISFTGSPTAASRPGLEPVLGTPGNYNALAWY